MNIKLKFHDLNIDQAMSAKSAVEYSFLEKGTAVHAPVTCKDFLTDVLWSEYTKNRVSIYSFNYSPGKLSLVPRMNLALSYETQSLEGCKDALQTFINLIEDCLDFPKSIITAHKKILVVDFDKEWTTHLVKGSFFTWMLRCGLTYPGGEVLEHLNQIKKQGNRYANLDANHLTPNVIKIISTLLDQKKFIASLDVLYEHYGSADIHAIHNNTGIVHWASKGVI